VSSSTHPTAQARVLTDVIPGERLRDVLLTAGFTLAIALSAQLFFYLPGNPVPITAQTGVVLAGAIALGTRRATAGAALYLVLGVAGLPLFAAANGATLGYIVGFLVASVLLGAWASRGGARGVGAVTAAMVVGNLVIYAFGVAWLAVVLNVVEPSFLAAFPGLEGPASLTTLLSYFVVPFLLGDVVLIAAAVAVVPGLWALVGRDR
jgi:biotin transport system substrate-specific component